MMQAGKDYGVEIVVAYEQKRVGQTIYPPGMLRQALVQRGLVKRLSAPPADLLGDAAGDSANEESAAGRRKSTRNAK